MLNQIKAFFSKYWLRVTGVVALVFMGLLYLLKLKDQKIEDYKAQISTIGDQRSSDVLEAKIKQDQANLDTNDSKVAQYNQLLAQLNLKRQQLTPGNLTPDQVQNYWNTPNND